LFSARRGGVVVIRLERRKVDQPGHLPSVNGPRQRSTTPSGNDRVSSAGTAQTLPLSEKRG
jgi:hypothetical protein